MEEKSEAEAEANVTCGEVYMWRCKVAVAAATIKTPVLSRFTLLNYAHHAARRGSRHCTCSFDSELMNSTNTLDSSSTTPLETSISTRINKPSRASMTRSPRSNSRATCASERPSPRCANSVANSTP